MRAIGMGQDWPSRQSALCVNDPTLIAQKRAIRMGHPDSWQTESPAGPGLPPSRSLSDELPASGSWLRIRDGSSIVPLYWARYLARVPLPTTTTSSLGCTRTWPAKTGEIVVPIPDEPKVVSTLPFELSRTTLKRLVPVVPSE
jgi:hypothetical protein